MSKRKNPFHDLTPRQQWAIKQRIELIAPEIQMGISAAGLISALWGEHRAVLYPIPIPKKKKMRRG